MEIEDRQSGCFGCRHRKMDGCASGQPHFPNGGPGVCRDTRKRSGFREIAFKATPDALEDDLQPTRYPTTG
jgi:hypothetical protein